MQLQQLHKPDQTITYYCIHEMLKDINKVLRLVLGQSVVAVLFFLCLLIFISIEPVLFFMFTMSQMIGYQEHIRKDPNSLVGIVKTLYSLSDSLPQYKDRHLRGVRS